MTLSDTSEETLPPVLYADVRGFWYKGSRFFPSIAEDWQEAEECNAVKIILPAGPQDELDWKEQRILAERCIAANKLLVWEIDWARPEAQTSFFTDAALFSAQALVLQAWGASLAPHFQDHTLGVIIYSGSACPPLENEAKERYHQWLEERENSQFYQHLYASLFLYEYLHRLGSFLPDSVPVVALLDAQDIPNLAEQAFIFSNERVGHLQLGVQNARVSLTGLCWQKGECKGGWIGHGQSSVNCALPQEFNIGICLPIEEFYNNETLENFSSILQLLQKAAIAYRLVPETLLNEQWDGLDHLLVLERALTVQGKRMLKGFIAAGGEIVYCDDLEDVKGWIRRIQ